MVEKKYYNYLILLIISNFLLTACLNTPSSLEDLVQEIQDGPLGDDVPLPPCEPETQEGTLEIQNTVSSLPVGQSLQMTGVGGCPPYEWSIISGDGWMTGKGLYHTGRYLPGADTIQLRDRLDQTQSMLVTLSAPGPFTPNDPMLAQQWGLNSNNDHDINAPEAWGLSFGCGQVRVGVIDTGIDLAHPDLIDNIHQQHSRNFVNPGQPATDDVYHGTHVAGIIGARGDNGIGVSGVCPVVSLLSLKIFNASGGFCSAGANAIAYAATNNVQVANASWACPSVGPGGSEFNALVSAMNMAKNAGMIMVVAAGNDELNLDSQPEYPASFADDDLYDYDNLLTVASVNRPLMLSNFSNFGFNSVSLAAPGGRTDSLNSAQHILSTVPTAVNAQMTANGLSANYDHLNGTSMAAPHVAGVAAFLRNWEPDLSAAEIVSRIESRIRAVPAISGDVTTGGVVDLYRTVDPELGP